MTGFSPKWDRYLGEDEANGVRVGGTGSAQTLPMSEEAMAAIKEKQPLGFAPLTKKRPRRKKAGS